MKRYRRFWGALLAAVMLVSAVPAAHAADKDGPSAPGLAALATDPSGLNGQTGQNDDLDYTKYDATIDISDIVYEFGTHNGFYYEVRDDFTWPEGTTILISVGHSSDKEVLTYIDVPEGKIVDVYDFGTAMDRSYTCWAHYDTTDGTEISEPSDPVTSIPGTTETPGTSENENTGNSGTSTGSYNSYFSDVQPGAWYYDAVMTMAENGILGGYGNGKFGPDDPLTYQQLWTILDRICNYEGDLWTMNGNDIWAKETVSRGAAAYTMAGGRWSARLNKGHTYYDIVMKNRANHIINETAVESLNDFPDGETIRTWSIEYATDYLNDHPDQMDSVSHMSSKLQEDIVNAYNYDFFAGVDSQGTFSPYSNLTRAQLCQALYRAGVYDKVG